MTAPRRDAHPCSSRARSRAGRPFTGSHAGMVIAGPILRAAPTGSSTRSLSLTPTAMGLSPRRFARPADSAPSAASRPTASPSGMAQAESTVGSFNGAVNTLAVLDLDGAGPLPARLYAGGDFAGVDGQPARGVAVFDGASWSGFGSGLPCAGVEPGCVRPGCGRPRARVALRGRDIPHGASCHAHQVCRPLERGGLGAGREAPVSDTEFLLPVDFDGPGPGVPVLLAGGKVVGDTSDIPNSIVGVWDGAAWSSPPRRINGQMSAMTSFDADGPGPQPAQLSWAAHARTAMVATVGGIAQDVDGEIHPMGTGTDGFVRTVAVWDADGAGPQSAWWRRADSLLMRTARLPPTSPYGMACVVGCRARAQQHGRERCQRRSVGVGASAAVCGRQVRSRGHAGCRSHRGLGRHSLASSARA